MKSSTKGKSGPLRSGAVLAVSMLAAGLTAHAQDPPQVQQILDRLERLEKDNQALLEEVRALRQEVAVLKPQPSIAGEVSAQQPTAGEREEVIQSRIEEIAQTKVEASQKFPIRITGMALFNATLNGRNNGDMENPLAASLYPGHETGGGTFRQSTLGLLFHGPETFLGGKITGSVYVDFFGGSTFTLNHLVRLRTASVDIAWKNTSLLVGQDKPLISPRDPESLAQVGYSPLSGAGNLWLWQPQIRLEQRFSLGESTGLRLQTGVFATSNLDYAPPYGGGPAATAQEFSHPGTENRIQLWHRWSDDARLEIAGGFHYNENRVNETVFPSEVYSLDWFLRPIPKIEFSGMFFHGQNVAVLGSLPQGFWVTPSGSVRAVHSSGGWAQIRVPVTTRLAFNVYGGQQDDRNSDLGYGRISKNQGYFGNLMYRFAPNTVLSLEAGQLRTDYIWIGNRVNNHYDLAVAYLF